MQWSDAESGKQYGVIGFAFLESPVVTPSGEVVDISDSSAIDGYGPGALQQEGLTTFKKWTISNDPPTPDLRYDFLSDGSKDHDVSIKGDMRLLFSTGPFTMPPGKSVETTVAIGIAQASTTNIELNKDSIVKLIAFAHTVFADTNGSYAVTQDSNATIVKHFITPVPPELPIMSTTSLDRAILVSWDKTSENSVDPLSPTLAFNTYELYRTTRSDHDSTIRPDGQNPIVKLGTWSRWDLKKDSIYNTMKLKTSGGKDTTITVFTGNYRYTRTNKIENVLPHSFLDIGDDNNDGLLNGNEGLLNGVKYYYFLLATDEFDSVNNVGPLTTAVVTPKNFVIGIPSRPVFPDLPNKIAGDIACYSGETEQGGTKIGGITGITLDIVDTGRYVDLFLNDTVKVAFQPRWLENGNPRFLNISRLDLYVNVTGTRQGLNLTYDKLYNPNASPSVTPYNTPSGILQEIIGQGQDSSYVGRFVTDNALFAPYQTIDQAFRVLIDYEFEQLKAPYRLKSITTKQGNQGDPHMIKLTTRTAQNANGKDIFANLADIPEDANMPAFIGALGESAFKITFGAPTTFREIDVIDTLGNLAELTKITDPGSGATFTPDHVLPIIITSNNHCDAQLKVIRPGYRNDVMVEGDARFYASDDRGATTTPGIFAPKYSVPDTMLVPIPGKFAVDAYHYSMPDANDPSLANFMMKTTGEFYFPFDSRNTDGTNTLGTVHRIRLGGAEIILNYPGINDKTHTGDSASSGRATADFNTGDEIVVSFTGLARGLPFPDAAFSIPTTPGKTIDLSSSDLYKDQKILDEVQVVPNPYIVTHLGQTSTENAKLFFTRLPPRATIEIYTLSGELVTTLEHQGYTPVDGGGISLNDRYRVQEWNLLSEGRQRVGSQVLIARIIAKDPITGAVLGETTKKFAVILGGYRQVVGN